MGIASVAFLGSAAVPAAVAATVEASAVGTLSIDTDPAGALAYVDGEPQGSTPVSVGGLPPGDHRIRVVKDGYLENSRVVNVRAGQANAVQVRLTTVSSSSPGPVLLEGRGQGKGGGGNKKWILIGAGAVAAGAAAYFVTHRNEPPTPGTVAVSTATLSCRPPRSPSPRRVRATPTTIP